MYLSVAGRVRHYGLLQTIGMTEWQIKVMLKEQLLLIGSMGIGTGCVTGAFVSFFLIPVIVKNLGIQSGYIDGIGVQFHPEFTSRPNRPHPLFQGFISAAFHENTKQEE